MNVLLIEKTGVVHLNAFFPLSPPGSAGRLKSPADPV